MRKPSVSQHEDAACQRARDDYIEVWGETRAKLRAVEIAALPTVEWRGRTGNKPPRTLYTLRCHADFGRGPHDMNLPESVLWNLMKLDRYRCPRHS